MFSFRTKLPLIPIAAQLIYFTALLPINPNEMYIYTVVIFSVFYANDAFQTIFTCVETIRHAKSKTNCPTAKALF